MVERAPGARGGHDSEGKRNRDHEQGYDRGQDERVRELILDLAPDGSLRSGGKSGCGIPKIASQDAAEPFAVALHGRLVEPHELAHLRDLIRRRRPAEDGARRVTWEDFS